MKKVAILFAGQGAQKVGMGKEFYEHDNEVKVLYDKASEILGYDLPDICFNENTLINQTQYTQPSILVTSLGIYHTLLKETKVKPNVVAGFSLGEYSALFAAGIFDFNQIVYLIKKRAYLMEKCANQYPGKMAAIIGLDVERLKNICNEVSNVKGIVQIANYNCPNQLVVAGLEDAVLAVCDIAKEKGARRALPLNVSGGFHTKLMHEAADRLYDYILETPHQNPHTDIIMNVTGDYLKVENLEVLMKKQVESSVYFEDSIRRMINDGVEAFIEIGPGSVLSGFVRKIDKKVEVMAINDLNDIERVKAWI